MIPSHKKAIVIHSGGMDSSICLALAIDAYGAQNVLSLSFRYDQRHSIELERAAQICEAWRVDNRVLEISCLSQITDNALINKQRVVDHQGESEVPNTLVVGRNGLMARLGAIHADSLGAQCIYMGIIEVESANSGYRDCSRAYMDLMQQILRIDLGNDQFEIRTPLVLMTKCETLEVAYKMGVLPYLLKTTISCYNGIPAEGCGYCPACYLRNQGIQEFMAAHPDFKSHEQ